jgi:hypothetical protein
MPERVAIIGGLLILSFWTSACFWMELWLATAVSIALLVLIAYHLFAASPPRPHEGHVET